MSIAGALQNAISGLTATGKLAAVTSGNLANALTEDYAARSVALSSTITGGNGSGVTVTGVVRAESPELTSARRIADGDLAAGQAGLDALTALERSFGAVGDDTSLAAHISRLEEALRHLADSPEAAPRQTAAALAAGDVAAKFNRISAESTRIRAAADAEAGRRVDEVNGALTRIARLNRQIQVFVAGGRDASGLIDQREALIDRVASAIPVREHRRDNGIVELTTAQGLQLVDTRARQIAFTPNPVITPAMRYDSGAGALSGLSLNGVDITPGGPGSQAIAGGALAGLFAVRDRLAVETSDRADALAADLIGRLAAPGLDPTVGPGDPGLFTDAGAAFDPLNLAGLAGRLRLNDAANPATGGNPALLRDGLGATVPGPAASAVLPRAMLDALTAQAGPSAIPGLPGAVSVAGAAAGLMELVTSGRVRAEADVAAFSAGRETLADAEAGRLAVDSDAELQALIRIEQAFAANVQVIQAASRMLDQLLEI